MKKFRALFILKASTDGWKQFRVHSSIGGKAGGWVMEIGVQCPILGRPGPILLLGERRGMMVFLVCI